MEGEEFSEAMSSYRKARLDIGRSADTLRAFSFL